MTNSQENTVSLKKQIRYGGFHVRACATLIDLFCSMLLLVPVLRLISPLIYGKISPFTLFQPIAYDAAKEMTASQQPPSIVRFVEYIIHDPRTYQYFVVEGGLWRIAIDQILQITIFIGIYLFFWLKFSATPGKFAMSLRIVDADTFGVPTRKQFVIRLLGYILSMLPLGIGFFSLAFNKRKQSWHDKLSHTVVIKK